MSSSSFFKKHIISTHTVNMDLKATPTTFYFGLAKKTIQHAVKKTKTIEIRS